MAVFDNVSGKYGKISLIQAAAGDKLIGLLDLTGREDILDVGCGPGQITARLKTASSGRVEGTDISKGMIEQAQKAYPRIKFVQVAAEDMDYDSEFDVVFCNSSFQWFPRPEKALVAMHKALRPGGCLGLAQPATRTWSSCFITVAQEAGGQPDTAAVFSRWKSPWFFPENEETCERLFSSAGFKTHHLRIVHETASYTVEKALANFLSGAGQGFILPQNYAIPVPENYFELFKSHAGEAMQRLSRDGQVEVDFNRLYYVGLKT
jgi:trans-aconitate 2-methyltransferase